MAESEADTPSTPIEFESKYFEFDGVRLPPFCRGKMEEIANFSLRSSDIWIVTYPKSGKRGPASPPSAHFLPVCVSVSLLPQVHVTTPVIVALIGSIGWLINARVISCHSGLVRSGSAQMLCL